MVVTPEAVVRGIRLRFTRCVSMVAYWRAPTFLMATGSEQVRSVTALLAGDHSAATEVRLVLPDAGACSTTIVDDASLENHATFMARLQQSHGRKHGFWGLMKP
jgi:hypothetical protein